MRHTSILPFKTLFFGGREKAEESFTLAPILQKKSHQSHQPAIFDVHTITRQICDKKSNHDLNICQGLYSHIDVEQRARLSGEQSRHRPGTGSSANADARPRRTATPKKAGRRRTLRRGLRFDGAPTRGDVSSDARRQESSRTEDWVPPNAALGMSAAPSKAPSPTPKDASSNAR